MSANTSVPTRSTRLKPAKTEPSIAFCTGGVPPFVSRAAPPRDGKALLPWCMNERGPNMFTIGCSHQKFVPYGIVSWSQAYQRSRRNHGPGRDVERVQVQR